MNRTEFLQNLRVGDKVIRLLAGTLPMHLIITKILPNKIVCGDYEFCRDCGVEQDEYLEWNCSHSGSYIKEIK